MEIQTIVDTISAKFSGAIVKQGINNGAPEITVTADSFYQVMKTLHEDKALVFDMLSDIVGIDRMPKTPRFDVCYILLSTKDFSRLIVRLEAEEGKDVPSVSDIWHSADWAEREVFDLVGIRFSNHPDLRRILTWENFEGHPLRKDFPLEGKDFDKPFDPTIIKDYC